ncbi:C2 domain-containing protein [Parasitella parasitica]|nr:C2 domain-containing protein [Parasitella parasitica]
MAHPPPIAGELVVVALKAVSCKQDPFCLFRVGDVVKRTKTDYGGGLYPIWDDQVNIPVAAGQRQLHVQVFDKDTKPNNLMGDGVVDLAKVLRDKEHDGYFPLQMCGRPTTGLIYLELTFYSAVSVLRFKQWNCD